MTADSIRVVFNRLLTPDTNIASLSQQVASLTTTMSQKELMFHRLHNDTSMNSMNSVVVDAGNSMNLALSENPNESLYQNSGGGYQVNFRKSKLVTNLFSSLPHFYLNVYVYNMFSA